MSLLSNPFRVLGATPLDPRGRLIELAEERSLQADPAECERARSQLTHPRNRLAAEVGWLPGVAPQAVAPLLEALARGTITSDMFRMLPPLAFSNVAGSLLASPAQQLSPNAVSGCIGALARANDAIEPEAVLGALNSERASAGLPAVPDTSSVEEALVARRRFFLDAIRVALDRLPTLSLIQVLTSVVESATAKGGKHAPLLVDQLVDAFEADARGFLDAEGSSVLALLAAVQRAAAWGAKPSDLRGPLTSMETVLKNWDSVAQPLQLSAMSRGHDHDASIELARKIRSVAVDLNNEHGLLEVATRLTQLLKTVFAEVPRILEMVEGDEQALRRLAASRG
jgi:hypothetical protein